MAVSASRVTVGGVAANTIEGRKSTVTDVTFDSSYPTGGEAITPADLGMSNVIDATCEVRAKGATVTNVYYDRTNAKLVANAAAAEVANTTDLSTVVVRVRAIGY